MKKKEREEEAKKKNKIVDKIDMDNGNFPYAKDIGKTLAKTTLTGSHRAIIDCILDMTYGWYDPKSVKVQRIKKRKTEEKITCRVFKYFTGIRRNHIPKYILELVNWKVIKRRKKGQYYLYSFNINVNQWNKGLFRQSVTRIGDTSKSVTRIGDSSVTRVGDTLSQGLGTLADFKTGKKAIYDKALKAIEKTPKETLKETIYKEREKEPIYIDKNLEKEREKKEIFDYWNSLNLFEHKTFNFFKDNIREALKNYSLVEIKNTIKIYSLILKDEKYFYSYEHMISGFLDPKNFEKFRDLEKAKKNFLIRRVGNETDSEDYNIPKYEPVQGKDDRSQKEIITERERISKLAGIAAKELKKKKG